MDTDDLSEETYNAIIAEAELFNDDLALQFGLLSDEFDSEEAYLTGAQKLIMEIRNLSNDDLTDLFFGEVQDRKLLNKTLDQIAGNINNVKNIPPEKRKARW